MSSRGGRRRSSTGLDAIGNSTKAITKGIAIATAVIAATSLFGSYEEALRVAGFAFEGIRVDRPNVLVGLLHRRVRRVPVQLARDPRGRPRRGAGRGGGAQPVPRRIRGSWTYTEKPDYGAVVDICTKTSLRELTTPGLLAVLAPLIAGFFLGPEALGAFLAGAILTGQLLAVMLSNSGGAWDNAKKFVEDGNYGGKGSDSHKAAVIGDTVGDPFKDTAGPALNPMIKVMNLVASADRPGGVLAVRRHRGARRDRDRVGDRARRDDLDLEEPRAPGLEDDFAKAKTARVGRVELVHGGASSVAGPPDRDR